MTSKGKNSAGSDFFRTSAFLMREFSAQNPMGESRDGISQSEAVIYVYDSDVIITRCAPWITGPADTSNHTGNGYGQIFAPTRTSEAANNTSKPEASNRNRSSIIVASILARHAIDLQDRRRGLPILQLPTHFAETNNVYKGVRRKVEAIDKVDRQRAQLRRNFELARLLAVVRHRLVAAKDESNINNLIDKIADLLAFRFDDDTRRAQVLREWDAYIDLEAEYGGIYSMSSAASFCDGDTPVINAVGVLDNSNRSLEEQYLFDKLTNYWRETLRKPEWALEADVDALAHLFLLNLRLSDHNVRVVFISGDRRLIEDVYRNPPIDTLLCGCADAGFRRKAELLAKTFSERHVRHLWAFVSDALIEQHEKGEFVSLFARVLKHDIFSGLLARWSNKLEVPNEELERLALDTGNPADVADHQIEDFLNQWDQLTHKAIQHSALSLQQREVQEAIISRLRSNSIGTSWTDLIDILEEDVARVRDRAVLALAELGIRQVIRAQLLGTRNPPEIVFDSLSRTNELVQRFSRSGAPITVEEFLHDFAAIKEDCHDSSHDQDDRQESYLKFVVLGAAFASAERWLIANSYAQKAVDIIRRTSQIGPIQTRARISDDAPKTNMSGREAFFLAAVSQRILARDDIEIAWAEYYLKKSERALEFDHAVQTAKNITPARFKNEQAALCLSQYYLARSRDQNKYHTDIVVKLYGAIEDVLAEFHQKFLQTELSPLERVTVVSAATNVIQCYVIGAFRRVRAVPGLDFCPVRLNDLRVALNVLQDQTTCGSTSTLGSHRITATPLMKSYAFVAEFIISGGLRREETIRKLQAMQEKNNVFVTHYDKWRYQSILNFIKIFYAEMQANAEQVSSAKVDQLRRVVRQA